MAAMVMRQMCGDENRTLVGFEDKTQGSAWPRICIVGPHGYRAGAGLPIAPPRRGEAAWQVVTAKVGVDVHARNLGCDFGKPWRGRFSAL